MRRKTPCCSYGDIRRSPLGERPFSGSNNRAKARLKVARIHAKVADVGWGEFVRQLEYKAEWYGRTLVKMDKFYPSSKRCFDCGHVMLKMPLHIRKWRYPKCGGHHDRDVNAAQNILAAGQAVLACGEAVRPARKLKSQREGKSQRSRKVNV